MQYIYNTYVIHLFLFDVNDVYMSQATTTAILTLQNIYFY